MSASMQRVLTEIVRRHMRSRMQDADCCTYDAGTRVRILQVVVPRRGKQIVARKENSANLDTRLSTPWQPSSRTPPQRQAPRACASTRCCCCCSPWVPDQALPGGRPSQGQAGSGRRPVVAAAGAAAVVAAAAGSDGEPGPRAPGSPGRRSY